MFTGGCGEMTAQEAKHAFAPIVQHHGPVKDDWGTLDHVEMTGDFSGTIG